MDIEQSMPICRTLKCEISDGLGKVTLSRPECLNAVNGEMLNELSSVVSALSNNNSVKAILLTGAGRAFCSGGDMVEMLDQKSPTPFESRQKIHKMLRTVLMPLVNIEKPVIAAVNGAAVGAGMNLALAADIVIAAESAKFSQVFVKVGLVPDTGGMYLLTRLAGLATAKDLCLTGRTISSLEAHRLGLVSRTVPDADLLRIATEEAMRLAGGATAAIGLTKSLLNKAPTSTLEEMAEYEAYALAVTLSTQDYREAVEAFREKRAPQFTGQ
jgi:2-(1,2-epoxy-1,2-dihydrophenyl)acetyl-CoA isomerase